MEGYQPYPPTQSMGQGGWDNQGGVVHPMVPPLATRMGELGILESSIHVFAPMMKDVVAAVVVPPPPPPIMLCTRWEGYNSLSPPPPFCMQDGVRCGTASYLGGGGLGGGADKRSDHNDPGATDGAPVLSEALWGAGAIQYIPTSIGVFYKHVPHGTITVSILRWGGFHTVDDASGYDYVICLWGQTPPSWSNSWTSIWTPQTPCGQAISYAWWLSRP